MFHAGYGRGTGLPPANWKSWAGDFWTLRGAIGGGGAPPDSVFFTTAARYAVQVDAPDPVQSVIAFGAALAARNYGVAANYGDRLLREAGAGRLWIPSDDLLDGAVYSMLATGDTGHARSAYTLLRPRTSRQPDDIRLALLRTALARAGADAGRTDPEGAR